MNTLVLKDLIKDTSSNEQGEVLFNLMKKYFNSSESFILEVDTDLSLSSSFLNSSFGQFLDLYGLISLKKIIKIKGSKFQFQKISNYIESYNEIYLV
ncbi:MAG: STAS-like domain-containing protein [Fluviicola sp.]